MAKKIFIKKTLIPSEYAMTLAEIKQQVQDAQLKAVMSVNQGLIRLYWNIGSIVLDS